MNRKYSDRSPQLTVDQGAIHSLAAEYYAVTAAFIATSSSPLKCHKVIISVAAVIICVKAGVPFPSQQDDLLSLRVRESEKINQ